MLRDKLRKIPVFVYIIVAVLLVATIVTSIVLSNQSNYIKRNNTITLLYDRARDETIMMYNNEVRWDDESYVADFIKLYDVCLTGDAIAAYNSSNGTLYKFDIKGKAAISDNLANFVLSDDGSTIAWVTNEGKVQLFNGVSVRDVSDSGSLVNFAISPNGKLLLYMETVNGQDVMKLYDTSSRKSTTVAVGMYPLSINKDGSVIYCLDASERLWCYNRDGQSQNSYDVLSEGIVQTNITHNQMIYYDKSGKTYVVDKGGDPVQIGDDKARLLLPDSTPVAYNVTTSKSYHVFVNGVKTFEGCLIIDGETAIKYMESFDKVRSIASGVTAASLSDKGDVLCYIVDNVLYRSTGSFKAATMIENGVASVSVTPDGEKAFFLTVANVLKCYSNGGIRSLIENCGNFMVTPQNGAMYMVGYDEDKLQGTLYFTQDGVTSYKLTDKAHDCYVTASGAYYTIGYVKNGENDIDYDVTLFGSEGDKDFVVLYEDVWDIYNYNYSY